MIARHTLFERAVVLKRNFDENRARKGIIAFQSTYPIGASHWSLINSEEKMYCLIASSLKKTSSGIVGRPLVISSIYRISTTQHNTPTSKLWLSTTGLTFFSSLIAFFSAPFSGSRRNPSFKILKRFRMLEK